ncbi:MAG: DNA recombination protein RmuC [Bdellovibrionales bacterium]|nr:DNA recombination protein RmuC [Bdellovibrionales bacterium]
MDTIYIIAISAAAFGLLIGFLLGKLRAANAAVLEERLHQREIQLAEFRANSDEKERELAALREHVTSLRSERAELETRIEDERRSTQDKIRILEEARERLTDTFKALSLDALKNNNQSFLDLAKQTFEKLQEGAKGELEKRQTAIDELVKPIHKSLEKVDTKIEEIEKTRRTAYGELTEQVKALGAAQQELRSETGNLVQALRTPRVRGAWGEIQLKRVVEMAGMLEYCDFSQQTTLTAEDRKLRPDMTVHLPNDRKIVVDSKAPLEAYLEAMSLTDEQLRAKHLKDHARLVKDHLRQLGAKGYWEHLDDSTEFVVLFLPGEAFFSAALETDPSLIEFGNDQRVIMATPTTLLALLKAVAYGWKQEQLAKNAKVMSTLGKELYDRINALAGHFSNLQRSLERSVDSYNKAVGSLESRVLVTARKFKELGTSTSSELPELEAIDQAPRELQSSEFLVRE